MATLDVILCVQEMPTWERPGRLCDFQLDGGGPVGTACAAAARLGARVGYLGTAGSDLQAEIKITALQSRGVDVSHVVRRDGPENEVVIVYVNQANGERVFSGRGRFSDSQLKVEELDADYIRPARFLHLDGFHQTAAMQAARWVQAAGGRVCLDGSRTDASQVSAHIASLMPYIDILICGAGFAQALTGCADPFAARQAALDLGPSIVVQTQGEQGSFTVTRSERFHTPAFKVPVVDTTGAGDVFHGAYLVGLLHGWDLAATAIFASAVAALKCTHLGGRSGIPTLNETLSFLNQRGITIPQPGETI
jgi:sulfofructose kinase